MNVPLRPGTVLCVRTGGFAATMIRLGAAFRGKPNLENHVAVVHHTDIHGTIWCIEGRPGGVGWRDATSYMQSPWTLTNTGQLFTATQGAAIAKQMEALLGTKYDWDSIAADALSDLGMRLPGWDSKWHGLVAGQVVCSSAAAYAYGKAGAAHPAGDRGCQPSDWTQWILTKGWEKLPASRAPPPLRRGRFSRSATEPR
jgi:hypothetical protein